MAKESAITAAQVEEFGIKFVTEVPDAKEATQRDTARWDFLAKYLPLNPGQWAEAKVYGKATSAGVTESNINNDRNARFPKSNWEARSEKRIIKNEVGEITVQSSTLFLKYTPSADVAAE